MGARFGMPTVVDQFTREWVRLEADRSMTGMEVAQALERARQERGSLPKNITVDNGSEFCSRALEAWAMTNEVHAHALLLHFALGPPGQTEPVSAEHAGTYAHD